MDDKKSTQEFLNYLQFCIVLCEDFANSLIIAKTCS